AMIPMCYGSAVGKIPGNDTRGYLYRGGVPLIGQYVWWYNNLVPRERLLLPADSTQEQPIRVRNTYSLQAQDFFDPFDPAKLPAMMHLPSKDILREIGGALTAYDNYITWTPGDSRWDQIEQINASMRPRVPALHITHWHDIGAGEITRYFKYLQD